MVIDMRSRPRSAFPRPTRPRTATPPTAIPPTTSTAPSDVFDFEGSGDEATLVFITHRAQEGAFQKTLQELRELPAVRAVQSLLRVEGEE